MPTAPGPRATCRVGGTWAGGVTPRATGGGDLSPEALAKGETRVMSNKQQKRGIRPVFYSCRMGYLPSIKF